MNECGKRTQNQFQQMIEHGSTRRKASFHPEVIQNQKCPDENAEASDRVALNRNNIGPFPREWSFLQTGDNQYSASGGSFIYQQWNEQV